MKKRVLLLLLTLALLLCCAVFSVSASSNVTPTNSAYSQASKCPCATCGGNTTPNWVEIDDLADITKAGHYAVPANVIVSKSSAWNMPSGNVVILVSGTIDMTGGSFRVGVSSTTTAWLLGGGGTIKGASTPTAHYNPSLIGVYAKGTANIIGDLTIESSETSETTALRGGIINVFAGTFNMYGGTVNSFALASANTNSHACVYVRGNASSGYGTFNMYGGTINGAFAKDGGAIEVDGGVPNASATNQCKGLVQICGGIVNGGGATNGGSIYLTSGTVNINGGTIAAKLVAADETGTVKKGGAIYMAAGTLNIGTENGGPTITGTKLASASFGGAVYVAGGTVSIKNATISGGQVSSTSTSNGLGGTIYMAAGSLEMENTTISGGKAYRGGCVYVAGKATFTMKSGSISEGDSTNQGGQVFLVGTFNMQGGTVTANSADTSGAPGFRVQGGKLNMSGDAVVVSAGTGDDDAVDVVTAGSTVSLAGNATIKNKDGGVDGNNIINIRYYEQKHAKLIVKAGWNGKARVKFECLGGTYTGGMVLDSACAESTGDYAGELYLDGVSYTPPIYAGENNTLQISDVQIYREENAKAQITWFKTNADAVSAYTSGYIKLFNSKALDIAGKEVYVDFNGNANQVTVGNGGMLYGMDSSAQEDAAGNAQATVTGDVATFATNPVTGDSFVTIQEGGVATFHMIKPVLSGVSLRPSVAGVYYSAKILCDEVLSEKVTAEYGIAVSLDNMPDDQFKSNTLYTEMKDKLNPGGTFNGVLISNILKGSEKDAENAVRKICANAYVTITLENGQSQTYLSSNTGNAAQWNLQDVMRKVNGIYRTLADGQKAGVDSLYNQYHDLMKQDEWRLHYIAKANGDESYTKDGVKILMIGNSLSVDAGRMLAYVFAQQGVDNVRISTLYYSGCTLKQHVKFLTQNSPEYTFYDCKYTDSEKATLTAGSLVPKTTSKYTMAKGIAEDQWDIVVMQQGTTTAAQPETYNEDIQTIMDYVNARQDKQPIYIWNSVWASPHDMISFASNDRQPDTGGSVYYSLMGYANEKDAAMAPEAQVQLSEMIANAAATKILPDQRFDYSIPSGIAQINAWSSCLDNWDLYRDYVHASDLGRLMNAYVWYSAITGEEITDIVDEIPAKLFNTSLEYYLKPSTNRPITQLEKEIMLESIANAFKNPYSMTQSQYTECPQQTGEEAENLRILMVGDSNTANVAAKLEMVYNEQMAGQKITVASLSCADASAYQHAENVKNSNAVYTYTANGESVQNVSFLHGITSQAWDMIILQPGAADLSSTTGFKRYNQNNRRDLERLIRENVQDPSCQLAWHTAWSDPTGDTFDPAALLTAQVNAYTSYVSYETMYAYRLNSGTAMVHAYQALGENAQATLWTDSALTEAGQYVAAYALYAQLGGVQLETAALAGDLAETVVAAANYAQQNPWTVPAASES